MKLILTLFFILLSSNFASAKECKYSLNKTDIKMKWTGYKTTDKVAVSGTFKSIDWSYKSSMTLSNLMKSIKFKIKTMSVNSGNSLRDKRVYKSFFKLMNKGEEISGYGISVDEKNKKAVIEIEMNGQRTPVIFSFEKNKKDLSFKLKSKIDILDHFKMTKSFKSIAELCKNLHTGKDGVSKTWSEVGLEITSKLIKTCIPKSSRS